LGSLPPRQSFQKPQTRSTRKRKSWSILLRSILERHAPLIACLFMTGLLRSLVLRLYICLRKSSFLILSFFLRISSLEISSRNLFSSLFFSSLYSPHNLCPRYHPASGGIDTKKDSSITDEGQSADQKCQTILFVPQSELDSRNRGNPHPNPSPLTPSPKPEPKP
jgi:hypothetical protein